VAADAGAANPASPSNPIPAASAAVVVDLNIAF
jgi:hypothetical protein